jgi:hypothetical protein
MYGEHRMMAQQTVEGFGPGALLADRFELRELVGSGASGVVFRALDRRSGDAVAVKVLRSANDEDVDRFSREVEALSRLSHDAVVSHVADGRTPGGQPFLAMAWLEGETLEARLARGALSTRECFALARRIAGALATAHDAGVLHRDVKPANIVLVDGALARATLVDFGLVRRRQDPIRSRAGVPLGTPAYMAPEQVRGELDLDARADLFGLGCVLYECLAGQRAFSGDDVIEVLSAVLLSEPAPLSERAPSSPTVLHRIIERTLAKDRARRPDSAAAVLALLEEAELQSAPRASIGPIARHAASAQAVLSAPASLAWALLADTDRWDRFCKAPRTQYVERADPVSERGLQRVGVADIMAHPSRWIEVGEGIEGRSLRAARRFIDGLFAEIGFDVDLAPAERGDSVVADVTVYVLDDGRAPEGGAAMMVGFLQSRLEVYLDAIRSLLARAPRALLAPLQGESGSSHGRRVLLALAWDDPVLSGRATVNQDGPWASRLALFADPIEHVSPSLQRALAALVERGADDVVRRVRPGELASAWEISARDALRALLAASRAGLFDLRWELRCRNCRSAAQTARRVDELTPTVHCHECAIDTETDLSSNVEVVFAASSALRPSSARFYCGASPAFRPHVAAFVSVAPSEARSFAVTVPEGAMLVRATRRAQSARVAYARRPCAVRAALTVRGWEVSVESAAEGTSDETLVTVVNETREPVDVQLEHLSDGAPASAVSVASLPEFASWFAGEAPLAGVELSLSSAAVLALECAAVEALCEREGDAAAGARVERAMRAATAEIERGGAVLRRTGAGLSALFETAALADEAFARAASAARASGVTLVGARYDGPSVALRRDDRIELFGAGAHGARSRALASATERREGEGEGAYWTRDGQGPWVLRATG